MRKILLTCGVATIGLVNICLVASLALALYNQRFFQQSPPSDTISFLDRARLEEAIQLRKNTGDTLWPGFGEIPIPVLVWSQDFEYLADHPNPPEEWHELSGMDGSDMPVYRKQAGNPQNFTILIGELWSASMASKSETDQFLIEQIHSMLPVGVRSIFPYFLVIQPSEVQISAVLHESFHAYQAQTFPNLLERAEAVHKLGEQYWEMDRLMREGWIKEISLLEDALNAKTTEEMIAKVHEFLETRKLRRQDVNLYPELIEYEKLLEWEEGLAKYVEMISWKTAGEAVSDQTYTPVSELENDQDFKEYRTFSNRWSQEITQMIRQAKEESEVRFYYTGMAQAFILDRLMPNWKKLVNDQRFSMEDFLRDAVNQTP